MKQMKLGFESRKAGSKAETAKLRREGFVPAIIYVQGQAAEAIVLKNAELMGAMRAVIAGRLPTTSFTLADAKGKERHVLIKELQYHPTTYDVLHVDFVELKKNTPVRVRVPIECTGVADCVGIKLGGTLRQVIRYLAVSCSPEKLPPVFELDIQKLGLFETKRLSDLPIPPEVRPLSDLNEVAVVIVKR